MGIVAHCHGGNCLVRKFQQRLDSNILALLCVELLYPLEQVRSQNSIQLSLLFSHEVVSNSVTPVDCSTPGFPVLHHLLELAQTHAQGVSDAMQPSHPLSPPSPPAFNLSQHQGLFQWVGSSHQVANILELQLQHQFFQWLFSVISYYLYLVWYHGPLRETHTYARNWKKWKLILW